METMRALLAASGFYLWKCLLPLSSQAYYPELPAGIPYILLGAIVVLSIFLIPLVSRRSRGARLVACVWFVSFLAPSLAIAVSAVGRSRVAERYAYAPSAAICLAAGDAVVLWLSAAAARGKARPARTIALAAGCAVAAVSMALCAAGNSPWRSSEEFWRKLADDLPEYGLPQLQLGQIHYERDRIDEAQAAFDRALSLRYDDAGRALARVNLGHIALVRSDWEGAIKEYREAARLRPGFAPAHYWLARALASFSEHETRDPAARRALLAEARTSVAKSLDLDPRDRQARELYARIAAALGE